MTGLPSSGKTTLSHLVREALVSVGHRSEIIDGDDLRQTICRDLGFSPVDRMEHSSRALLIARFLLQKNVIPIVAMISPYKESRRQARAQIGEGFIEVFLECPIETCMRRDVKGLYRSAIKGELKGMTGVDAEYESPEHPELLLHTASEIATESAARILRYLSDGGFTARTTNAGRPLLRGGTGEESFCPAVTRRRLSRRRTP
jgi:adenylyl-sulfate kinase